MGKFKKNRKRTDFQAGSKSQSRQKDNNKIISTNNPALAISLSDNRTYLDKLPPPLLPVPCQNNGFLADVSPYRDSYRMALETSYEGFVCDVPNKKVKEDASGKISVQCGASDDGNYSSKRDYNETTPFSHSKIRLALAKMDHAGLFRTDVTQPFGLGTKCAKTYVTRCLYVLLFPMLDMAVSHCSLLLLRNIESITFNFCSNFLMFLLLLLS